MTGTLEGEGHVEGKRGRGLLVNSVKIYLFIT
jgi:hypothetical protein